MPAKPSFPRRFTPELLAVLVLLAACIAWTLSMPLLPTEDGPVHLYYAQILSRLLTHSDPVTAHFFRIKHVLPPYSLYYYALVLFGHFVSFSLADRLVVCLYFVLFVFGFRFLAQAIGPAADRATLLATVLLLNWPLGMGFVNFDLAIALALWAVGLWLRSLGQPGARRRVLFVALTVLVMLTHPVPLLLVLVLCGITLVIHVCQHRRRSPSSRLPLHFVADVITLCLAALTLGYVKLFTRANALTQVDRSTLSLPVQVLNRIHRYGTEYGVCFLNGHALVISAYRIGLMLVLLAALYFALRQRLRNRAAGVWSIGDTWLVCAVLLLLAMPALPASVNGSTHFADRLLIFVWIAALCAASGYQSLTERSAMRTAFIIAFAVAINACLLYAANAVVRPLAEQIAAPESLPVTHRGQLGLILDDLRPATASNYANPTWDPYMWAPVNFFRRQEAILANPPWLDLAIIPIGATPALPASWIPHRLDDMPLYLARDLQSSPADRARILSSVSFLFITQPELPPLATLGPMSSGDAALDHLWPCQAGADPWYRLCNRRQPGATHP